MFTPVIGNLEMGLLLPYCSSVMFATPNMGVTGAVSSKKSKIHIKEGQVNYMSCIICRNEGAITEL